MYRNDDRFKRLLNRIAKNLAIGENVDDGSILNEVPVTFPGSRPNTGIINVVDVGRPSEDTSSSCCELGCCAIQYVIRKIMNWSNIRDGVLSITGDSEVFVTLPTQGQMAFSPQRVMLFYRRQACLSTTEEGCRKIQQTFAGGKSIATKPNPICGEELIITKTGFKKGKNCEQSGCVSGYVQQADPIKLAFLAEGSTEAVYLNADFFVNPNTYNAIKMAMIGGCMSQTFEQLTNITDAVAQESAYADAVDVTTTGAVVLLIGPGLIAARSAIGACQSFRLIGLGEFGGSINTVMYGTNYKLVFKELLKLIFEGAIAGQAANVTLASILSTEIMRAKLASLNPTNTTLEPANGICYGESPVIDTPSLEDLDLVNLPWQEYFNESK